MNKLYFYTLPDEYINYLSSLDKRVCLNKEQKRPYIGIIFKVGEINYFAPFTSPKVKHKTMRKAIDYVKISNGELGIINLNNMIPVPLEICNKIDITDIKKDKYKALVLKQYKWCNEENNYKNIVGSARRLYSIVVNKKCSESLLNRCCDYKLLEEKFNEYTNLRFECLV